HPSHRQAGADQRGRLEPRRLSGAEAGYEHEFIRQCAAVALEPLRRDGSLAELLAAIGDDQGPAQEIYARAVYRSAGGESARSPTQSGDRAAARVHRRGVAQGGGTIDGTGEIAGEEDAARRVRRA